MVHPHYLFHPGPGWLRVWNRLALASSLVAAIVILLTLALIAFLG